MGGRARRFTIARPGCIMNWRLAWAMEDPGFVVTHLPCCSESCCSSYNPGWSCSSPGTPEFCHRGLYHSDTSRFLLKNYHLRGSQKSTGNDAGGSAAGRVLIQGAGRCVLTVLTSRVLEAFLCTRPRPESSNALDSGVQKGCVIRGSSPAHQFLNSHSEA